jgi:3-dehydroquinate synthase
MGKPDRTSPDGEEAYDRSVPEAELAGVFHKLYSVQDPNGQWFDYPVILAWQIDRKGSTTAQPFPLKTFFAVAMVLLGYGILRWQIRRRDLMNRQEESYRLRAAESTTACSPQAVEVDPLLIQAAQDTRSGNTLTTERTIRVELGRRSYSVRVGAGMLERLGAMVAELPRASWAALIADSNVAGLYAAAAMKSLDTAGVGATLVVFPTGEEHKTLATFGRLMDSLFAITPAIDRDTVIVALGGGVTGDLAGFVAATALRGLRWLQCPTTLLADVDASVGGKTAIDHPSGKNLIGAFHQPQGVLIDVAALKTLPPEELRSGLAECVKHGMIADSTLLDFIEHNAARILAADEEILTELVARNVAIKAAVVSADEREASVRAHLNFGHTIGHAIEATVGFGSISHGQAVAMGMVSACAMALRRGLIDPAILQRLERLLKLLGLPTRRSGLDPDRIWQIMQHDKKARKGGVRMILPVRLGGVSVYDQIDQREVRESLDRLSETK